MSGRKETQLIPVEVQDIAKDWFAYNTAAGIELGDVLNIAVKCYRAGQNDVRHEYRRLREQREK